MFFWLNKRRITSCYLQIIDKPFCKAIYENSMSIRLKITNNTITIREHELHQGSSTEQNYDFSNCNKGEPIVENSHTTVLRPFDGCGTLIFCSELVDPSLSKTDPHSHPCSSCLETTKQRLPGTISVSMFFWAGAKPQTQPHFNSFRRHPPFNRENFYKPHPSSPPSVLVTILQNSPTRICILSLSSSSQHGLTTCYDLIGAASNCSR